MRHDHWPKNDLDLMLGPIDPDLVIPRSIGLTSIPPKPDTETILDHLAYSLSGLVYHLGTHLPVTRLTAASKGQTTCYNSQIEMEEEIIGNRWKNHSNNSWVQISPIWGMIQVRSRSLSFIGGPSFLGGPRSGTSSQVRSGSCISWVWPKSVGERITS